MNKSIEIQYVTDDLFEELKECITCPVCFNKFQSPIMGCSNGHAVCNSCIRVGNMKKCPTCKVKKMDCRQLGIEKIAKKLSWPCSNKDVGCPEMLKFEKLSNHEKICRYQKSICCPISACNSSILMLPKDIEEHMFNVHDIHKENFDTVCKDTIFDMDFELNPFNKGKSLKKKTVEIHRLIKIEDVLFLITIIETGENIKFRSTKISSPENKDEYFFEKEFGVKNTDKTFSIIEPLTDIVERVELKRKASELKCEDLNCDLFSMNYSRMCNLRSEEKTEDGVNYFLQMRSSFLKR